jgi:hypothetical protein
MTFTKDRTIGLAHIDREAKFIRVLRFWFDNERGHTRSWAINRFDNTLAFKFVKFGIELFAKVEHGL